MKIEKAMGKTRFSRRSFLQWAGALSAAAATYSCSSSSEDVPVVIPQGGLIFDKTVKEINAGHHAHCGGCCMIKLHVKNGRLLKVTSAGDISYERANANADRLFANGNKYGIVPGVWGGGEAADESLAPIQRRACMKGLSEAKRIYALDRLKYPLMQTRERGDRNGFVRITWEKAYEEIVKMLKEMQEEAKTLGYLPIWDNSGIASSLGNYISTFGSSSTGGVNDGYWAALGNYTNSYYNTALDMLNSKFIINWSNDARSNRNSLPFYMMKAKEAGIPIVDINCRHTETAAAMATGSAADGVPPVITVNAGTETALQIAMAYVIYKNNLHDQAFINEYAFGFNANTDTVNTNHTRTKASNSPGNDPLKTGQSGTAWDKLMHTVPTGESFVEYLISLENDWGGAAGNTWNGVNATVGDATYSAVLAEAERISGVPAKVIENLAKKYATSKPSFIHSAYNGGASRAQNGMYHTWMLIALSTMCGHINKRGGGPGEVRFGDGYPIRLGAAPASTTPPSAGKAIPVLKWQLADTVLTGRDFRTIDELREDVQKILPNLVIPDSGLKIKMLYRGSGDTAPIQQSPDLTKNMVVFKDKSKIKYIVAQEQFLSPDASIADIILPAAVNLEESYFTTRYTDDQLAVQSPLKPLYDSKPDWLILQELRNAMGLEASRYNGASDEEVMKTQWEGASIPQDYLNDIDSTATLPAYEKMIEEANIQLTVPLDKSRVDITKTAAGQFSTETGYIQFWNPYLKRRGRAVLEVYGARYAPMKEGYETLLQYPEGMPGMKKDKQGNPYTYSLQLTTPHMIQRAHSTYDNIPMIKDVMPHVVYLHPITAGKRGINNGDPVYIYNDNGCIKLKAELTKRVKPHSVVIGQGAWYRPSTTETYEAWFRNGGERHLGAPAAGGLGGTIATYTVPVDVGGAVNSLVLGRPCGTADPLISGSVALPTVGNLCEVSKVHPDKM